MSYQENINQNHPQDSMPDQAIAAMLDKVKEFGFEQFQEIIALGRWPDGTLLDQAEKPVALQALIIYEHQYVPLSERTGFIFKGHCSN